MAARTSGKRGGTALRPRSLSSGDLDVTEALDLAVAFKALGDPVRLQLLARIASHPDGEACVCDLTPGFDLTGPTISHHLKVLRESGLVTSVRRRTWVYYKVVPELTTRLSALLDVDVAAVR